MDETSNHTASGANHGRLLAAWEFPAVTPHQRGRGWFWGMSVAGAGVAAVGVWMGNYVFVLALALFALTFHLVRRSPYHVRCEIFEDGVAVGKSFYPYRELKRFWILYQPPEVKTLYFEFANPLKARLPIPLQDQNPVAIRHFLLEYLAEDLHRDEEPVLDQISRLLKL